MRKIYFSFLTVLALIFSAANQASAQNYIFTTSTGNAIVPGTTLVAGSQDDDAALPITLPFAYTAYGVVFNSVNASTNGNLQFQTAANDWTNECPPSATANLGLAFMPHWDDLDMSSGGALGIYTSVSGVAPNRIFNIEWRALRFGGSLPVNFEVRLFEGIQKVDYIYGAVDGNGTSASIGMQGAIAPSTLATTFSCNSVSLSSGLAISFTVQPPCAGTPSPGSISGPSTTLCSPTPATLTLSGFPATGGITFQWKSSSTAGGPYTAIPGATNSSYSFSAVSTAYYIVTVTCTISGLAANTAEFALTVSKPIHTGVTATPSTVCSPGSTVVSGTVTGGVLAGGIGVIGSSGTINLAIPDNVPAGITTPPITIPATNIPSAASLKVRINMSHTWVGDLKFTLTSPCGISFLFDRPGVPPLSFGNGDNLGTTNSGSNPPPAVYTFDVAGATVIPETTGGTGFIAVGTYKPSDVNGAAHSWAGLTFPCAAAGNWTLTISDNGLGDIGTLVDWAILGPGTGNYTHTLTGPGTITQNAPTGANNSTGNFSVTGLPAGNQTFILTSTDVLGCSVSTSVSVLVNQTPAVTLTTTPAPPVICAGGILQINGTAIPPSTQTFSATGLNTIPASGPAALYPSNILVSGLPAANVSVKSVTINGIIHTFPSDIDIVLQSPSGTTNVVLMSDIGGGNPLNGQTYTLDDAAASLLTSGFNPTGTYKPTNIGATDNWPAPGPGTLTQASPTLASFGSGNMNGNWNLYVVDDGPPDAGSISSWSITFNILSPVVFSSPNSNDLFTDNLATIPYTGTPAYVVYAKPAAATTYTATYTTGVCTPGSANVTVTVNKLPAITVQPTPAAQTICPGFTVTYSVTADLVAGLTYQWRKAGVPLVNGGFISGATTSTLTIANVSAANSGSYDVVVSGTCPPQVISSAVVLNVAAAPTITTQPANLSVCQNGNAVFSVVATGIPPPTIFQWQSSPDGVVWTNLTTGGASTPTFTITGVTTAQNGTRYRVIITNSCGQTITSGAATLTVNGTTAVVATDLWAQRICISDTLIPLTGTPIGGSWSGNGVSGFNFFPAATAVGTYILTYTYTNSLGCTSSDTTKVIVSDCQERIRLLRNDALKLYPNPNKGQFNIQIRSTLYNTLIMKVYNTSGQLMVGKSVKDAVTLNRSITAPTFNGLVYGRVVPIDLSYLPAGTYLIKFIYDDGIRTSDKTFTVVISHN